MNGLLAMPTSEALVRMPNPAPCARGGMTLPATLYDAVIAAPIPRPRKLAAIHISHTRCDAPTMPEPAAAVTAPHAITTRGENRCSNRPQK